MENHGTAMVLASFAADSLALGAHWIYDTPRIEKEFGRVETFLKPKADSYHPSKDKGEFTHYGDQAFVLLESLASAKGFEPDNFAGRWKTLFEDYAGYVDHATKVTLHNLSQGKHPLDAGSSSEELAGASRIAPLVFFYRENPDALAEAARVQTKMTHNHPMVVDSAEFFARVAFMVLKGRSPVTSMKKIAEEKFYGTPVLKWVTEGIASAGEESVPVIARFGQSCHYGDALPGVVHLIATYEKNLKEALVQCVMAGGDSAGRGMITGMILGAYLGRDGIPQEWIRELKQHEAIVRLLEAAL
ncbi:MAG: ADP-ribosylglycohydrolase family protein [Pseudomonadota bacterium]